MNEFYPQQLMAQQYGELAPQGFFGGLLGAPLGGLIGRGIGGLFGNANLGRQIGQAAGGIGGGLLPFGVDPVTAAYAQQQQQQQQQLLQQAQMAQMAQMAQLAPQGWFGNIIKSVGRPLGGAIGGAFGNAGLGGTIGGIAGQLGGMLPFAADPLTAAYLQQQQQQQPQQELGPQSLFGDLFRKAHPYTSIYNPFIPQQPSLLPFGIDPMTAAYAQQGLAPQGWFGNLIRNVAQPLGGAIGGAFGNAGIGNTIGGIAGQLGGMLPFGADPVAAAYAQQQAQLAQLAAQQGQTLH